VCTGQKACAGLEADVEGMNRMPILLCEVSADIRHNIAQACQAASMHRERKAILSHRHRGCETQVQAVHALAAERLETAGNLQALIRSRDDLCRVEGKHPASSPGASSI
jgi:hypothetical protein